MVSLSLPLPQRVIRKSLLLRVTGLVWKVLVSGGYIRQAAPQDYSLCGVAAQEKEVRRSRLHGNFIYLFKLFNTPVPYKSSSEGQDETKK